jgi:quercetin dioxygenase-like cupin family protein
MKEILSSEIAIGLKTTVIEMRNRVMSGGQEKDILNVLKQSSLKGHAMTEKKSESLAEKILDPKDLIAYQDGSVVSRMIVHKKSGTITLFAFDAGEGLSEHTAPFDAIVSVLDGEAEVSIGQNLFVLREGQMIIMPANRPHALSAQQRFKMMLTMIHE